MILALKCVCMKQGRRGTGNYEIFDSVILGQGQGREGAAKGRNYSYVSLPPLWRGKPLVFICYDKISAHCIDNA